MASCPSVGDHQHHRLHGCPCNVDFDFRPIKIHVYKNGDERDEGRIVHVTRRHFRHWIVFLDHLTRVLRTTTAVNKLFTIDGRSITHFEDLESNGEYVGVEKGPFVACDYGRFVEKLRNRDTRFMVSGISFPNLYREHFLDGADAMDIYLKQHGYGSCTGLPYPMDGFEKSSSLSFLKTSPNGGSQERLQEIGREPSWVKSVNEKSPKDRPPSRIPISNGKALTKSHPDLRINLTGIRQDEQKNGLETLMKRSQMNEKTLQPIVSQRENEEGNAVVIRISVPQSTNKETLKVEAKAQEMERPESRSAATQTDTQPKNSKITSTNEAKNEEDKHLNPEKSFAKVFEFPTENPTSDSSKKPISLLLQRPKLNQPTVSEFEFEKDITNDIDDMRDMVDEKNAREEMKTKKDISEDCDDIDVGLLKLPPIHQKIVSTGSEGKIRGFRQNRFEFHEEKDIYRARRRHHLNRRLLRRSGSYDPDFDNI
ncbi:unnamed protein product, partial [Mesorhabditis belari]|uniref:Doublecortin domain-containing protein n=1 Tax=Mesorhabditis belari TaxID=2138241 RepID=A0AAF3EWZ5_9BILA